MSAYIRALLERKRASAAQVKADEERRRQEDRAAQAAMADADQYRIESARIAEAERAEIIAKAEGARGPIGPMPKHQWRGTELRFEIEPGKWGKRVDLRGPAGVGGGGGGGSAFIPGSIQLVEQPVVDTDTLILERGGIAYRVTIAALKDLFGSSVPADAVYAGDDPILAGDDYVIAS